MLSTAVLYVPDLFLGAILPFLDIPAVGNAMAVSQALYQLLRGSMVHLVVGRGGRQPMPRLLPSTRDRCRVLSLLIRGYRAVWPPEGLLEGLRNLHTLHVHWQTGGGGRRTLLFHVPEPVTNLQLVCSRRVAC